MVEYLDILKRPGISLERLATLCRVIDAGGLARAAGKEPSRLSLYSRQIKDLERALGVPLTERVGRVARPSAAAVRLAAIARDHLKALGDFSAGADAPPRSVTVGAGTSLLEWVVLPRIAALREGVGATVTIRLQSWRSADLAEALRDRRCDLGLLRSTAAGRGLRTSPLLEIDYALFVPAALGRGKGAAAILGAAPLATATGGEFRRRLDESAARAGVPLHVSLECSSFSAAAIAVKRGAYAAVLPGIAAAVFEGTDVRRLDLPFDLGARREILLAAHPHLPEKTFEAVRRALETALRPSTTGASGGSLVRGKPGSPKCSRRRVSG